MKERRAITSRVVGVTVFVAIIAGLGFAFQTGFGRTRPEDQYRALLSYDLGRGGLSFRGFLRADPVSLLETKGKATAVAIIDGVGLHESLSFTVHANAAEAQESMGRIRQRYSDRETFEDVNTWPEELCVRLTEHRLDCFRSIDNLVLHSSVVPLPSEWGDRQPWRTEFEPLGLLRTGYKQWLVRIKYAEQWPT